MTRFAANVSMLFTEKPFLDRFEAARAAGFGGVECLFPYDHDPQEIRAALLDCGLPLILFNTPPGDFQAGERGHAAIPGAEATFENGLRQALDYAEVLKPLHIHVMSGNAHGVAAHKTLDINLNRALTLAPDQSFLIEPLNAQDMPGYYLSEFGQAAAVIAETGMRIGLQFDLFHAARMGHDPVHVWNDVGRMTRHVQFAAAPDRSEPDPALLTAFTAKAQANGYDGWFSAEYRPKTRTLEGLGWMDAVALGSTAP
jgi:hydroxypyruvate isomerase